MLDRFKIDTQTDIHNSTHTQIHTHKTFPRFRSHTCTLHVPTPARLAAEAQWVCSWVCSMVCSLVWGWVYSMKCSECVQCTVHWGVQQMLHNRYSWVCSFVCSMLCSMLCSGCVQCTVMCSLQRIILLAVSAHNEVT